MASLAVAESPAALGRQSLLGATASWRRLIVALYQPIDISMIVAFRFLFGGIMLFEVYRYFARDWIRQYYIVPSFHFTYLGFDWVRPWPGMSMYLHFALLGLLATCVALGIHYRVAAVLFFLGYTYVFLLEKALYQNHLYLIGLIAFILIFLPAHRACSLDEWGKTRPSTQTAPAWTLWLLRFQIGLPYFYGGLAKLNDDWLLAEPMRMWLASKNGRPVVGPWLAQEWVAYAFSYSGLLFDLLVVPFLLWRRTRLVAYVIAVAFHLMNAWLFQIGIFPWFMIGATLVFFSPDLPRRAISLARSMATRKLSRNARSIAPALQREVHSISLTTSRKIGAGLVGAYVAVQLLVPLRHYVYPGEVNWTDEGHRFSWHMKLRNKAGDAEFLVVDASTAAQWKFDSPATLRRWQYEDMKVRPDMIHQYAQHLASQNALTGYSPRVYVDSSAALNGRLEQRLIDPTVDLSAQERSLLPSSWILPLEQPARPSQRD